jgi:ribosomal-protein-alanine N-acetyltransferase
MNTATMLHAAPEHAAILAALHAASFPAPWQPQEFATLLSQPGVAGWIALRHGPEKCERFSHESASPQLDGMPQGFILVRAVVDEAEILTLAVAPQERRKGVASKLIEHAHAALRGGPAARMFLEVAADNARAIALYMRHGFAECGRRPGYYNAGRAQGPADALIMKRDRA